MPRHSSAPPKERRSVDLGSRLLIGMSYLVAQLPFSVQYRLGRWLGRLSRRIVRSRAKIVDMNLRLCFPELSEEDREELAIRTFESVGVMWFEVASLAFGRADEIVNRGRVWGGDELQQAVDEGNGIILIGVHLNSMEAAAAIMHRNGFEFSCITRSQKNQVIDEYFKRHRRSRFGSENIFDLKQFNNAIRYLGRKKTNMWLASDQDMGLRRGTTVMAPFFGVEASTVASPIRVATLWKEENRPALVLMSQHRDEKEQRVHVKFKRIKDLPLEDVCQAAAQLNGYIEDAIREHPEQWFWVHKRFKTLSDGKRRDYNAS